MGVDPDSVKASASASEKRSQRDPSAKSGFRASGEHGLMRPRRKRHASGLRDCRCRLGWLRAGQPADRRPRDTGGLDRGWRARLEPTDPHSCRVHEIARPSELDLGLQGRGRSRHQWPRHPLSARPGIGRLELDQRLIYIRGQPEDFDHWAQLGNRGWGWDDVLPYFKRAEDWQGEASELHGNGGFLTTSPMSERPAACQAIIEAAQEIGLEYRSDVNNLPPGAGDSIGWCQQTRGGRRRASAARTYLRPASRRPNLQVVTGALVHRVIFDGKRAVGVELSLNNGTERIDAEREVILAAGAVGSPHLLQLSGVGDPEVLSKAGVPVNHALPGVGRNF